MVLANLETVEGIYKVEVKGNDNNHIVLKVNLKTTIEIMEILGIVGDRSDRELGTNLRERNIVEAIPVGVSILEDI